MDEIEKRLRETSEHCYNCYEAWDKNKKDLKTREALQESIHELRKVASRLEIELAISERDDVPQKRIPIPPHRDARKRDPDDQQPDFNSDQGQGRSSKPRGKRGPKKEARGNS